VQFTMLDISRAITVGPETLGDFVLMYIIALVCVGLIIWLTSDETGD
jgi:hypothetical protein